MLLSISLSISSSDGIIVVLPLGAVGVAGVTFIVGLGVLEDETVGALQAVGALLHTVGAVFEVAASHALVGALGKGEREREGEQARERETVRDPEGVKSWLRQEFQKLRPDPQSSHVPELYCGKLRTINQEKNRLLIWMFFIFVNVRSYMCSPKGVVALPGRKTSCFLLLHHRD